MNTTLLLSSVLVAFAGQWAKEGEAIQYEFFVGVVFLTLFIAAIGSANAHFANSLMGLILVTELLYYSPSILGNLGLT